MNKTVALVIGNNEYEGGQKLDNAVNDAIKISEVFSLLGYDVIQSIDCNAAQCSQSLADFEENIKESDSAIFYFAGHGFQCEGENYLAAIDCPTDNPNRHICERTCIRLSEILEIFKNASTKVNIAIIDACRRTIGRGASDSFSAISVPSGTIIAFSTSPGDGAKDEGMEGHSVYTGALLKYIGREFLSVEELFKKVRKTVYNFTDGSQTSWEHTSLVGDFYFNTGQMVHSFDLPYDSKVIKDRFYDPQNNQVDEIIVNLKSTDWNKQNPSMRRLSSISPNEITKNQQFILGRNILQCSTHAFTATNFCENLNSSLMRYTIENENHLLNGMLFEMYFDNNGDFRNGNFKIYYYDKIFALRKLDSYLSSFEFINNVLKPYKEFLFYIPSLEDGIIDIEFKVNQITNEKRDGEAEQNQVVESIKVADKDITGAFSDYCRQNKDEEYIKQCLSELILAPPELVNIICNFDLTNVIFEQEDSYF